MTAIALIIAALLVAGGGTAAALIVTKDKDKKKPTPAAQAAQQSAPTDSVKSPPPETTPKDPTVSAPTPPPDTTPTPPDDTSGTDDALAAQEAAQTHWEKIGNHEFDSAYDDFWSGFSYSGGRSKWITDQQGEEIESVEPNFGVANVDGDRARVPIVSLITNDVHGCKTWSGYLRMINEGGEWKIEKSKIGFSGCGE